MTHSLLDDPLFNIRTRSGEADQLSLPGLLAAYSAERVEALLSLRPHQEAMFHAFMVSLAFMAAELAGELNANTALSTDAHRWRELLRGLTPDFPDDEPWQLLVDDWTKPAFMQSPCADGDAAQYTGVSRSPQELDVLVTSKSHDIKPGKLGGFGSEHAELWIFALVSLHGDAAYMPAGQKAASVYSSVRKNGAVATRSQFRLTSSRGVGAEFIRDVSALLEGRASLYEEARACGLGDVPTERLMWIRPWTYPFAATALHPLFLEQCRRTRLALSPSGALIVRTAPSQHLGWRVQFGAARGVLGDPWAPLERDEAGDKSYNPQTKLGGFGYRRLAPVLFDREKFTLPLLARPIDLEKVQGGTMVARALVRAQGGTDGYLSRDVSFPPQALRRTTEGSARLALRSQAFLQAASDMQGKVLRSALIQYVDGTDDPNWKSPDIGRAVQPWEKAFDAAVDEVFFTDLLDSVAEERSDDDALLLWLRRLQALAQQVFERATDSLPTRDRSNAFSRARAEGFLRGAMRKRFPALYIAPPQNPDGAAQEQEALHE